jgi:dTDP-glucose pyrophosphorylase
MSGTEVLHRKSEYVVEWAEHDTEAHRADQSATDPELHGIVRFRIEGVRRVEPKPQPPTDDEAMLGEPPF